MQRVLPVTVGLLVVCTGPAWSWARPMPNWKTTLGEAEVIVVGHLVGDPVYVAHQRGPDDGRSGEFHARLAVTEVLRGELPDREIPIILHYGLSPSRYVQDGQVMSRGRESYPGQAIWDTGSFSDEGPVLADADTDAIWLLGHYTDRFGRNDRATEELGIRGPRQLWPIKFLPFIRAALEPETSEELLALLHDPDEDVRRECLQYCINSEETRAFPAVAELVADEELGNLAVEACRVCGGEAAVPHLRGLLADETQGMFGAAAGALAALHDAESLPRLVEVAQSGRTARARASAIRALGMLSDLRAIPALVETLKADLLWPAGRELWQQTQESLRWLTGCTLSPNGDRAQRWWEAAQDRDRTAWEHFEAAQRIDALLTCGPHGQSRSDSILARLAGGRPGGVIRLDRMRPKQYDPAEGQRLWREWLREQGWNDYQDLPSQADDELTVTAELTGALDSGEPVRIRYTVTNRSDREVWLTTSPYEPQSVRFRNGNGYGYYLSEGQYNRPRETSREAFVRLAPGEQWTYVGGRIFRKGDRRQPSGPAVVQPALVFDRKGTSVGLDAWVGEVWAEPIHFAEESE